MKHSIVPALLATTMLLPAAALAQAPATPAAETAEEGVIVVTARKREENLQEVPIAITAIGADTIQAARIESLGDVAKLTPGLGYTPLFGKQNQLPIIRGVAQTLGQLNVGVFLDGVYLSGKAAVDLELNDLARIEVIKGPQSALYGRNTFAGAINYVTQRPSRDLAGRAEVTGGSNGLFKAVASVSGPISDTVRARVGGFYRKFNGFYNSSIDGGRVDFERGYGATATLEWQPIEPLIVTLRATYSKDEDGQPASNVVRNNAGIGVPAGAPPTQLRNLLYIGRLPAFARNGVLVSTGGLNLQPGGVANAAISRPNPIAGQPNIVTTTPNVTAAFPAIDYFGDRQEAIRVSATTEYDAGPIVLTSISSFARRTGAFTYDGDNTICDRATGCPNFGPPLAFNANSFALSSATQRLTDYSQELRFASSGETRFKYLFGLFYYHNENDGIDRSIVPTQAAANAYLFPRQTVTTDAYSVFGSAGYEITDALTVTGELRYEYEEQTFIQGPTNPAGSGTLALNTTGLFDLRQSFRFATPRVIVDYKLSRGNLLYASYARGAKTGGFNTGQNIGADQRTFQPEFSDNYEIGVKTTLDNGRLRLNASAYLIDWKNQQVVDQNPITAGGSSTNRSYTTNTASSRIYGLELDGVWQPVAWFGLNANYAYTNAKYRSFIDATLNGTAGPPFTPGALFLAGLPQLSFDGKSLPYVPKHKFVVSPTFTLPFAGEGNSIEARVDVSHQSATFLRADNFATFAPRTNVDLRITARYQNAYLQLFANNVFDIDTPVAGVRFFDSTNYSVASPYVTGAPRRQLGATLGYKF